MVLTSWSAPQSAQGFFYVATQGLMSGFIMAQDTDATYSTPNPFGLPHGHNCRQAQSVLLHSCVRPCKATELEVGAHGVKHGHLEFLEVPDVGEHFCSAHSMSDHESRSPVTPLFPQPSLASAQPLHPLLSSPSLTVCLTGRK